MDGLINDRRPQSSAEVAMWIREEMHIFTEVIPVAAKRASMNDVGWIH
jgi:hypothetical protein